MWPGMVNTALTRQPILISEDTPDLEHVLSLHSKLHISKTATARRFVSLHKKCLTAVFVKNGAFQYAERGEEFPFIALERGQALPLCQRPGVILRSLKWS
jgi:hypothetical protein